MRDHGPVAFETAERAAMSSVADEVQPHMITESSPDLEIKCPVRKALDDFAAAAAENRKAPEEAFRRPRTCPVALADVARTPATSTHAETVVVPRRAASNPCYALNIAAA